MNGSVVNDDTENQYLLNHSGPSVKNEGDGRLVMTEVNEALDSCGFPLCKGDIMASNPAWCLSLDEWQLAFGAWMATSEPEALLNSTIFFDFRALYGQDSLAGELREWLLARAPLYPIFLRCMVENSMNWESPLNWWQGFRYDGNKKYPHTIDLKMHGSGHQYRRAFARCCPVDRHADP